MANRVEADNGYIIKAIVDKRLQKKKKKMLGDHSYANTYLHVSPEIWKRKYFLLYFIRRDNGQLLKLFRPVDAASLHRNRKKHTKCERVKLGEIFNTTFQQYSTEYMRESVAGPPALSYPHDLAYSHAYKLSDTLAEYA